MPAVPFSSGQPWFWSSRGCSLTQKIHSNRIQKTKRSNDLFRWTHQISHFAQTIWELVKGLDCFHPWRAGTSSVQQALCVLQSLLSGHLESRRTAELWHPEQPLEPEDTHHRVSGYGFNYSTDTFRQIQTPFFSNRFDLLWVLALKAAPTGDHVVTFLRASVNKPLCFTKYRKRPHADILYLSVWPVRSYLGCLCWQWLTEDMLN